MKFNLILSCFVAILALVNPIQKVLIVTSLQERFSPTELRYISIKSTITAMLILIFFLYLGQVTFSYVFRVELYSFQITCGAVLMYNGLSGLLKGFFMKGDFIMQDKATNPGKTSRPEKNPLDAKTTYHIGNRSFVVEPVFKEESPDTLGSVLLRLMKSESEKL